MIGRRIARIFAACALVLLAGCSIGREFHLPRERLQLGKTTPAELAALVGPPHERAMMTTSSADPEAQSKSIFNAAAVPGSYERLIYFHADTTGQQLVGGLSGVRPQRSLVCLFWNGTLASYSFESSFGTDSTNFDDGKIAAIERNKSTRADVLRLLGAPSGESIYPIMAVNDGRVLLYRYSQTNLSQRERSAKLLRIHVDAGDVVRDIAFNSSTAPLPVAPAPSSTYVPIIIPKGK